MKLITCPKCHGAVLLTSSRTNPTDMVSCPLCGHADYVYAFSGDHQPNHAGSGALYPALTDLLANMADDIVDGRDLTAALNSLSAQYCVEPRLLADVLNAFIGNRHTPEYNPTYFVRIEEQVVPTVVDEPAARAVAATNPTPQAEPWRERYEEARLETERLRQSLSDLNQQYKETKQELDRIRQEYGL